MSRQTTYDVTPLPGYPGLVDGLRNDVITKLTEVTAVSMVPGRIVSRGVIDPIRGAVVGGLNPLGLVVREHRENTEDGDPVYPDTYQIGVLIDGCAWAIVLGEPVAGVNLTYDPDNGLIYAGIPGEGLLPLNGVLEIPPTGDDHIGLIRLWPQAFASVMVDGETITGSGTNADPLVATPESGAVGDGVTVTGTGTTADPLVATPESGAVADGTTVSGTGTTADPLVAV